ncbi:MAG TPA: F0F1 ATP synthase subunit B [Armatimonadota bacterium]|nr:F0F1 ATP synthase subunit B [Armatimonadota bacterium]
MDFGALLETLHISPPELIVNMLGFVFLFLVLRKIYYGPISKFLDEREQGIRESLEEAEAAREEARVERDKLRAELEQIETTARNQIQEATQQAAEAREEILAAARDEASKELGRAMEQLAREKEKALVEIKDHAADIAVDACEAILRRTLTDDRHRVLVDEFLRDLESFRPAAGTDN